MPWCSPNPAGQVTQVVIEMDRLTRTLAEWALGGDQSQPTLRVSWPAALRQLVESVEQAETCSASRVRSAGMSGSPNSCSAVASQTQPTNRAQYTSAQIVELCTGLGLQSVGRTGCAGTPPGNRFGPPSRAAFYNRHSWPTRAEARLAVGRWSEERYNRRSHYSAVAMMTPVQFAEHHRRLAPRPDRAWHLARITVQVPYQGPINVALTPCCAKGSGSCAWRRRTGERSTTGCQRCPPELDLDIPRRSAASQSRCRGSRCRRGAPDGSRRPRPHRSRHRHHPDLAAVRPRRNPFADTP